MTPCNCNPYPLPNPTVERQLEVIATLQDRVERDAKNRPGGDLKDAAIALGVALDKLELLTRNH